MDESGKNANHLVVGSMWFLGGGYPILALHRKLLEFKELINFKKEFHFSTMSRNDLPAYFDMINLFLKEAPAISFKIVSLPTVGIRNKQDALFQLFYHLLVRGVETENETSRAVLPRTLQVWKDAEEEGVDSLLVADLDDRLKQAATSRFSSELYVDEIRCVDSGYHGSKPWERKRTLKKSEFTGKLLWLPHHRSKANEPTRHILPEY